MIPESTSDPHLRHISVPSRRHNFPQPSSPAPRPKLPRPNEEAPTSSGLRVRAQSRATNPSPTPGGLRVACSLTPVLLRGQKHLLQNECGAAGSLPNPSPATLQTCLHFKATDPGMKTRGWEARALSHKPSSPLGSSLPPCYSTERAPSSGARPRPPSSPSQKNQIKSKSPPPRQLIKLREFGV